MPVAGERRRPGPQPRFSREQLVDEAIAIVDEDGFERLSLRAVARRLGVTPMALYTYVRSGEELVHLVVERLVELKANAVEFPTRWQDTLRAFATNLAELVIEHPGMLGAYAAGVVNTGEAMRVADQVVERLLADGLTPDEAVEAYLGVHALALGYVVLARPPDALAARAADHDPTSYPSVALTRAARQRFSQAEPLATVVDLLIAGVEARRERRLSAS